MKNRLKYVENYQQIYQERSQWAGDLEPPQTEAQPPPPFEPQMKYHFVEEFMEKHHFWSLSHCPLRKTWRHLWNSGEIMTTIFEARLHPTCKGFLMYKSFYRLYTFSTMFSLFIPQLLLPVFILQLLVSMKSVVLLLLLYAF